MVMSVKGYIDHKSVVTFPVGIYTASDSSLVTGMPAALGNHSAIVIRTAYGPSSLIATVVIILKGI